MTWFVVASDNIRLTSTPDAAVSHLLQNRRLLDSATALWLR
jgi:hypothetical protein